MCLAQGHTDAQTSNPSVLSQPLYRRATALSSIFGSDMSGQDDVPCARMVVMSLELALCDQIW